MAWVLVKRLQEDMSIKLSSLWVLDPTPISESGLTVKEVCFWKWKSSRWNTLILAVAGTASHFPCVHNLMMLQLLSAVSANWKWLVHDQRRHHGKYSFRSHRVPVVLLSSVHYESFLSNVKLVLNRRTFLAKSDGSVTV